MSIRWSGPLLLLPLLLSGVARAQEADEKSTSTQSAAASSDAPGASAAASSSGGAAAKPSGPPAQRLQLSSLSIIRLNPLGLETQNRVMYQKRMMESSSALFSNTFVAGGLSLKLNPAYYKVGPLLDIQPIALLHLRLGYEYMSFFGSFNYLQSFPDPSTDYGDDYRNDTNAANAYKTTGHHAFVEPTFQIKVKSIALRSKWAIEYWNMATQDSAYVDPTTGETVAADGLTDSVFYDATLDTNVPAKGTVVATDTDLLFVPGPRLVAGLRYSAVFPRYAGSDWLGGTENVSIDNSHMRIGPLVAWSFNTKDMTGFNKPTLLANVAYYFDHRNRTGSAYILVGFGFTSDFIRGT